MPAIFVHGNPETSELWDAVRFHVRRQDTAALSFPGFGSPRPASFSASKDEYVEWLIVELEHIGEPVDLVGTDWGGFFTVRVASLRPDLLRSWASDSFEAFDRRYTPHPLARVWQTPSVGETWVEQALAAPLRSRAAAFESMGVPRVLAPMVAGWFDQDMGDSMLALYRSAIDIAVTWPPDLKLSRSPALAMLATADPIRNHAVFRDVAVRAGARIVELEGLGHFWMLQEPKLGARLLDEFWSSLADIRSS